MSPLTDFLSQNLLDGVDLDAFLRVQGWQQVSRADGQYSQWRRPDDSGDVLVPLSRTWGDYDELIALGIAQVADATGIPEERLLRDVALTRADVVVVRAAVATPADGSLPLTDGLALLQTGYNSIEAAALAEHQRRSYYIGLRPQRVVTYMNQVRMGQTEVGSFVVPIISRLPSAVSDPDEIVGSETVVPFERRVTRRLASGVQAALDAAAIAEASGNFTPFTAAIGAGVSANLCEALSDFNPQGRTSAVTFQIRWSRALADSPPPANLTVPTSLAATFKEAASRLRPDAHDRVATVVGPVVHLDRAEGEEDGTVGIRATLDGQLRTVYVDLPEPWYVQAVRAHETKRPVVCTGLLLVRGRRRSIEQATDFSVPELSLPGIDEPTSA